MRDRAGRNCKPELPWVGRQAASAAPPNTKGPCASGAASAPFGTRAGAASGWRRELPASGAALAALGRVVAGVATLGLEVGPAESICDVGVAFGVLVRESAGVAGRNFGKNCSVSRCASSASVTAKRRRTKESTGLLPTLYSLSANTIILMPVATRITAKT